MILNKDLSLMNGVNWRMVFGVVAIFSATGSASDKIIANLTLEPVDHIRRQSPCSWRIPNNILNIPHASLLCKETGKRIPAQIDSSGQSRLVWVLERDLAAGEARSYEVFSDQILPKKKVHMRAVETKESIRLLDGSRPVLQYNCAVIPSPNKDHPYYRRSGHIHPLYDPKGRVITDEFPADHLHQHAVFFPWTKCTYKGKPLNFWEQSQKNAEIRHHKVLRLYSGDVFCGFDVILHHVAFPETDDAEVVLQEVRRIRVYRQSGSFLIDFDSFQTGQGSEPLLINKYHYGGMAIRGQRDWYEPGEGFFLTSEGKTREDGNHTRPRWVDIYGQMDQGISGATILCHPGNFRAPQPVRLHPSKPYFCFAPMVLGDFSIKPNQDYVSRYRFNVHLNAPDPIRIEQLYKDYALPLIK